MAFFKYFPFESLITQDVIDLQNFDVKGHAAFFRDSVSSTRRACRRVTKPPGNSSPTCVA